MQQTLVAETVVWKQGILVMPRIVHQVRTATQADSSQAAVLWSNHRNAPSSDDLHPCSSHLLGRTPERLLPNLAAWTMDCSHVQMFCHPSSGLSRLQNPSPASPTLLLA